MITVRVGTAARPTSRPPVDPGAAGHGKQRDGHDTDAVHEMVGGISVTGGVGLLGEPWPEEGIWTAFCLFGLAD